ncbi:MAG: hypothetical protein WAN65_09915 [Candidatus Sulfotelmatobacter sp.]
MAPETIDQEEITLSVPPPGAGGGGGPAKKIAANLVGLRLVDFTALTSGSSGPGDERD